MNAFIARCGTCQRVIAVPAGDSTIPAVVCCGSVFLLTSAEWFRSSETSIGVASLMSPRLEFVEPIDCGMNAVVIAARDRILDRVVAVKIPMSSHPGAEALLRTESRKIAALEHPNVPAIYAFDALTDSATGDVFPATVMQYVRGRNLRSLSFSGYGVSSYDPRTVFWSLCDTLLFFHEHECYHGDLETLANILVARSSQIYLIDFGVSRPILKESSAFDLRSADVRAVLAAARHLFGPQIRVSVRPDDDLRSAVERLERDLTPGRGKYSFSHSQQQRFRHSIPTQTGRETYRLAEKSVDLEIRRSGAVSMRTTLRVVPFPTVDRVGQYVFFEGPMTLKDFNLRVGRGSIGKTDIQLLEYASSATETRIDFRVLLDPPVSEPEDVWYSCEVPPEAGMRPQADLHSADILRPVEVLRFRFHFPDATLPTTWTATRELASVEYREIPPEEWLSLDRECRTATCTFRNLRLFETVTVRYLEESAESSA